MVKQELAEVTPIAVKQGGVHDLEYVIGKLNHIEVIQIFWEL